MITAPPLKLHYACISIQYIILDLFVTSYSIMQGLIMSSSKAQTTGSD
jgi:hypothetical protein